MSVIFESTIKSNDLGLAYIQLRDTVTDKVEICNDLEDYANKIESLGLEYGGRIDEVKWFVDEDVTQVEIDKIKLAMAKYNEELNKK